MSYIGAEPTSAAFVTDTFNGNGSTTAFTMSAAPAGTTSIIVAVSGVLQDPSTYSVSGTTLTFSAAPPSGTGNISVRFLGIPASGVVNTAYRTQTEFTATAGQTTFSVPSYTVGYIDVYRNGALLGSADFTATNGTTVVLANAASAGDLVETVSFYVSSVLNAIPAVANAVTTSYINNGAVTAAKMAASGAWAPVGTVIKVVQGTVVTTETLFTSATYADAVTVSITPSSSSNKILLVTSIFGQANGTATTGSLRLTRDSTAIATWVEWVRSSNYGGGSGQMTASLNYLDSPATTSAITYRLQVARTAGSDNCFYSVSSSPTIIIAMEIAG
jgi:hypothetical protein